MDCGLIVNVVPDAAGSIRDMCFSQKLIFLHYFKLQVLPEIDF